MENEEVGVPHAESSVDRLQCIGDGLGSLHGCGLRPMKIGMLKWMMMVVLTMCRIISNNEVQ
jgi:hypothetical protein